MAELYRGGPRGAKASGQVWMEPGRDPMVKNAAVSPRVQQCLVASSKYQRACIQDERDRSVALNSAESDAVDSKKNGIEGFRRGNE
jgi:hypothetical protein